MKVLGSKHAALSNDSAIFSNDSVDPFPNFLDDVLGTLGVHLEKNVIEIVRQARTIFIRQTQKLIPSSFQFESRTINIAIAAEGDECHKFHVPISSR